MLAAGSFSTAPFRSRASLRYASFHYITLPFISPASAPHSKSGSITSLHKGLPAIPLRNIGCRHQHKATLQVLQFMQSCPPPMAADYCSIPSIPVLLRSVQSPPLPGQPTLKAVCFTYPLRLVSPRLFRCIYFFTAPFLRDK